MSALFVAGVNTISESISDKFKTYIDPSSIDEESDMNQNLTDSYANRTLQADQEDSNDYSNINEEGLNISKTKE